MTHRKQPSYQSYLLRLWQETNGSHLQWRASLESAQTGDIYRFASMEALFAFLRRRGVSPNFRSEAEPPPLQKTDK